MGRLISKSLPTLLVQGTEIALFLKEDDIGY